MEGLEPAGRLAASGSSPRAGRRRRPGPRCRPAPGSRCARATSGIGAVGRAVRAAGVSGCSRSTPSTNPKKPLQNEMAIQANITTKIAKNTTSVTLKPSLPSTVHISDAAERRRCRGPAARAACAASRPCRHSGRGSRARASAVMAATRRRRSRSATLPRSVSEGPHVDRLLAVGLEVDEQPPALLPRQGFDVAAQQLAARQA